MFLFTIFLESAHVTTNGPPLERLCRIPSFGVVPRQPLKSAIAFHPTPADPSVQITTKGQSLANNIGWVNLVSNKNSGGWHVKSERYCWEDEVKEEDDFDPSGNVRTL